MNKTSRTKAGFDHERLDRISAWMQRSVHKRRFCNIFILIKRYGQDTFHYAVGLRDIVAAKPFTRNTVVRFIL
jgi:hypothetical protein